LSPIAVVVAASVVAISEREVEECTRSPHVIGGAADEPELGDPVHGHGLLGVVRQATGQRRLTFKRRGDPIHGSEMAGESSGREGKSRLEKEKSPSRLRRRAASGKCRNVSEWARRWCPRLLPLEDGDGSGNRGSMSVDTGDLGRLGRRRCWWG
jgi:hypothetical protein